MLVPNQVAPKLIVPTLSHGIFDLTKEKSRNFTMVVFFRGLHCPICINYLSELARLQSEFFDNGENQSCDRHISPPQQIAKTDSKY